jgi:dihydrofolate synthase / folylpolyglutamate synthase
MRPAEGLAHLASLPASSIKMGLSRVLAALARLEHPERDLPALHVAGTNGKGSTCALAASCLGQRYRIGLYTSPHLLAVNERFRVGGADVTDEALGAAVAEVVGRLGGPGHGLTYFELGTLVAFWLFARQRLDLAVLETGLGGRLDATTACVPLVTCITPLGLDHQAYLGSTLTAIAGEKAGIVKAGAPLVSSRQPEEALPVLEAASRRAAVPLLLEGRDFGLDQDRYRGVARQVSGLHTPLAGPHQRQNLAVALACLEQLEARGFPLSDDEWRQGVAATRWPGRLEQTRTDPPVVLDGAHNPAGVEALLAALGALYPGRPVSLVFGVFADKDYPAMIHALFPRCQAVYLAPLDSPRGLAPEAVKASAGAVGPRLEACASAAEALRRARAEVVPGGIVLVAGSLSLVGELRGVLVGEGALTR